MDVAARVTSKGQVTVPKAVRDALGIEAGDEIVFRVEGRHAVLAAHPISSSWPGRSPFPLRSGTCRGTTSSGAHAPNERPVAVERVRRHQHHRSPPHG